jgi:hypothetical protein
MKRNVDERSSRISGSEIFAPTLAPTTNGT